VTGRQAAGGLGLALVVLLAALAGTAAAFVHRTRVDVGPLVLPVGMVAALVALVGLVLLARWLGRSRLAVGLVAAAFAVPVLLGSQFRPEGDLVVAQDPWGLTLLGGIALVVTASMMVPVRTYHGVSPALRGAAPPTHETAGP
jgi:hypothetical protein